MTQTLSIGARIRPYRDFSKNPKSHTCATHLRRICGTCVHWTGALRGVGDCPLYADQTSAGASAATCADWSRKIAPQGVSPDA